MVVGTSDRNLGRALNEIAGAIGDTRLAIEPDTLDLYASDSTPRRCRPVGVVFPSTHDDVAAVVRLAYRHGLPLVARGAGSGNAGGALPTPGSLVVSFECMNRILDFSPVDRTITIEAGMITSQIDRHAREAGLRYPVDPGSGAFCRIGGNIAMNASGPRTLKYGATRDYVLALRAVDGTGRSLRTGGRTSKSAVGYDLTRLIVGSEGTLALVTEATLRLVPVATAVHTLRACYTSSQTACEAVTRVMAQGCQPSALEFMDGTAMAAIEDAGAAGDLPAGTRAMLIVEWDGEAVGVERELATLARALTGPGLLELASAGRPDETERLWAARKSLSGAVQRIAPLKINEDVVVPVSRLGALVAFIESLAGEVRLPIVCFGHAGNGNLHVNVMIDPADGDQRERAMRSISALLRYVLAQGGRLSGEHGIGSEKRRFLPWDLDPHALALMRAIKSQFDPRGILNPGKLFPAIENADPTAP